MKKAKTDSFNLTLKLCTSSSDEGVLSKRFYIAFLVKNRLIRYVRERLTTLRQDHEYRSLIKEYSIYKGRTDKESKRKRSEIGKLLSGLQLKYGLSEYQFHSWIAVQQHRYSKDIDSFTAQKIATSVWQAVEKVLYGNGKAVHFQRLDDLVSLEGKSNTLGIRFKDGRLYWLGLCIQLQIDKGDTYAKEALSRRVKYCRIKRMAMGTTYHYYLQLILEGRPPQKHQFIDGRVGIDPGVSSEAVFSENGCILTELACDSENIERRVANLQRKMDRSRRANNPDHYNPDGTVKRTRKPWNNSKTYKRDRMRLKTLRRRHTATVKQSEEILANEILVCHGSDIVTEKMNYSGLQRCTKETTKNHRGRFKRRGRFGKSLSRHAPSRFLSILERKLNYINKTVNYVDTWKFRASQYDHVVGDYIPVPLSKRSKMVGTDRVQRDLYSAFLLWCAADDTTIDRNLCFEAFPLFLSFQDTCIADLITEGQNLSSFGLKDFVAI